MNTSISKYHRFSQFGLEKRSQDKYHKKTWIGDTIVYKTVLVFFHVEHIKVFGFAHLNMP